MCQKGFNRTISEFCYFALIDIHFEYYTYIMSCIPLFSSAFVVIQTYVQYQVKVFLQELPQCDILAHNNETESLMAQIVIIEKRP